MERQISKDELRNTFVARLQDEECCHICGMQFDSGDVWGYVDSDEVFNEDEGSVLRRFRTHWHLDCHYALVTVRGQH